MSGTGEVPNYLKRFDDEEAERRALAKAQAEFIAAQTRAGEEDRARHEAQRADHARDVEDAIRHRRAIEGVWVRQEERADARHRRALRYELAGKAMQAMVGSWADGTGLEEASKHKIADLAVSFADALIERLEQP